ncbi:uncharacterized protein EDB91DRAFT_674717 [Suillus paluster]|uniref:uncharacterized protein n=1 Tax=Suillus paluster TaxID=48578 RepID=UPI001B86F922|nr:uncharacterized protein EDB91DRAFT_674717 [Suillus paluster]KAG1732440.1 hypothetical protein EDB91DRAFT_674717 [Suillus paluster]
MWNAHMFFSNCIYGLAWTECGSFQVTICTPGLGTLISDIHVLVFRPEGDNYQAVAEAYFAGAISSLVAGVWRHWMRAR